MTLTSTDLAAHGALGITPDWLTRAQVCRVDDAGARARLSSRHPGDLSGILYPYIHPHNGHATTYRLRRDHPEMEHGQPKDKYLSAWGDRKRLYFPPDCAALLADVTVDVVITEAEKSVLSITCAAETVGRRVLAIATGGCWGWRGRIGKTDDATGARVDEVGVLPDFDYITWTGRTVFIAFDANAATNTKVQAARRLLANELTARGAVVRILDLPAETAVNGPDDLIGAHGAEAFFALMTTDPSDCAFPGCARGDSCDDDQHIAWTRAEAEAWARGDNRDSSDDRPPIADADASQANTRATAAAGLADLEDATDVAAEGRHIAATGIPYVVDGLIPAYGMLGMCVAYAKVGKTTFGQALGQAVATGQTFIGRTTTQGRVLVLAPEDPPEYTAFLARHLTVPAGVFTFYRRPLVLDPASLAQICATVRDGSYALVLIASWQAVVRGLIRDENDNAGAVQIVERVKAATRQTAIPWLIDAHSGKGEDQADDADPSRAMRGASGAAGAADYTLSLRYATTPFGSQRRLSGKGRFISFAPLTLDFDPEHGSYTVVSTTKAALTESTWQLIQQTGAITRTPQSVDAIARRAGLAPDGTRVTGTQRRQVRDALRQRDGIRMSSETRRGQITTLYCEASS